MWRDVNGATYHAGYERGDDSMDLDHTAVPDVEDLRAS
jgi:hypothetical protein